MFGLGLRRLVSKNDQWQPVSTLVFKMIAGSVHFYQGGCAES
jgi:hypothetical protein